MSMAEGAPSDSLARGASTQSAGVIPATWQKRSQSSSEGAPGGGTVMTVTWSAPTPFAHRLTIWPADCRRQKRLPAPPPCSIACRYSAQVEVPRFLTVSCHIAGTVRPRSRTVTTTRRLVPGKSLTSWAMRGARMGARDSIDTMAVPGWALISSRRLAQAPSCACLLPFRSATARACVPQVGPGKRMPCWASVSRFTLHRCWMNVVPDFIKPMCSTSRSATCLPL